MENYWPGKLPAGYVVEPWAAHVCEETIWISG